MVRALIDTCVLSEMHRQGPASELVRFVRHFDPRQVFVSAITLGEISKGIHALDDGARKQGLVQWLDAVEQEYADRLLPVDSAVARVWGELSGRSRRRGVQIPFADALIAATALVHGLHVMTRNSRDFESTGALILDPWAGM